MAGMRALHLAMVLCVLGSAAGCDGGVKQSLKKALGQYAAYDGKADPEAQLKAALAEAQARNTRVIAQFGGNWCVFCQALDELIERDATLKGLQQKYVTIHIDAGSADAMNARYGKPFDHGFPVILVFDKDGKLIHTQASTSFQLPGVVGHDPAGVAAFLSAWLPPT